MTGGYIKNAVVRAAVIAARAGRAMVAEDLWTGAHHEYVEMGKVMPQLPPGSAMSDDLRSADAQEGHRACSRSRLALAAAALHAVRRVLARTGSSNGNARSSIGVRPARATASARRLRRRRDAATARAPTPIAELVDDARAAIERQSWRRARSCRSRLDHVRSRCLARRARPARAPPALAVARKKRVDLPIAPTTIALLGIMVGADHRLRVRRDQAGPARHRRRRPQLLGVRRRRA